LLICYYPYLVHNVEFKKRIWISMLYYAKDMNLISNDHRANCNFID